MTDWAMDSSGIRHAHRAGVLGMVRPPERIVISPLTWQPTPDALWAPAAAPELRFPDPFGPSAGGQLPLSGFDSTTEPHPVAALCELLEILHAAGAIMLAGDEACHPLRVADVEQMWQPAGLVGRPTDESIAAVLTAEKADLPLVCADVSVRRLARHCGLNTVSVEQFAAALAA